MIGDDLERFAPGHYSGHAVCPKAMAQLGSQALDGKVNLLTWMIGFNLAMTVAVLWRVVAH